MAKTQAIVVLERAGVEFRTHEYAHDASADSYGEEAAEKLGLDPHRVFKTLVASVDGALTVAVVPVASQLDLRALGKRAAMAAKHDAERATGYVSGGISPLGQRRRLPAIVDESALGHESVFVSGGRRGLQLELRPADLVRLIDARVEKIVRRG